MLGRVNYVRFRRGILAAAFIAGGCALFALAPRIWTEYSPLFGVLAVCTSLLLLLPIIPVLYYRWHNPRSSAFMRQTQAHTRRLGLAPSELRYQWVDLSQISPHMCLAAIVAEDFTFPIHSGIVWDSLVSARAANRGIQDRDFWRGGSTISQQMVKNLYLWSARSYLRKAIELYLTLVTEVLWSKRRILEVYLNIAQLGENVFGVQAASRLYFDKPSSALSLQECALLAAALPNPLIYPVSRPSPGMRFRQAIILNGIKKTSPQYLEYMRNIGLIVPEIVSAHDVPGPGAPPNHESQIQI